MTARQDLPILDDSDRDQLLAIARRSLVEMVAGRSFDPPAPARGSALERHDGVFVTLKRDQRLRGCIGHLVGSQPLPGSVARLARAAAREDPRFPPLQSGELDGLSIEVTVMSPLEPIHGVDEIEVGRHGLVVEQGFQRGLLLPQVATEQGWDALTFLRHTCSKAGLPTDAWQHGAKIFRFEAVYFGERD